MINNRAPVRSIPCDKGALGITRGKVIFLRREGSHSKGGDFFKINKIIGEGGSCICYEVTLVGEGKTGRLKEFYPLECRGQGGVFSLSRSEKNHVIASPETKDAFVSACEEFVKPYHALRGVIEKNKGNSGFTSFIPDFSIYYASDAEGNFIEGSTAYVWTAPENLTVFERYIEAAHKHPGANPEHKLFTILRTVLTLTDCVRIMHESGLLHLDIKPANFGIPRRRDKLLTDSITLFDVNSIYSVSGEALSGYGTEGFSAPEVSGGAADNTSDIYSIGCTLFSALVPVTDGSPSGYYKEYYPRLDELVRSSGLIKAADAVLSDRLIPRLVGILKKCLAASARKRYQSSVELSEDLEGALAYLYPSVVNSRLPLGQRLVIMENAPEKKGVDLYLAFMYHLYKKPLFEYVSLDAETVDVLIIGFGRYGQRFLDCCLQLGQILGKRLNVKVIFNDGELSLRDKEAYLSSRPALADFFVIDGIGTDDPYGYITFESHKFVRGDIKGNRALAAMVASEYREGDYVFIALGDDRLNKSIAKAISETGREVSINYAYDGETVTGRPCGNPVYTSRDVKAEADYAQIERMAFNVHLIYESGLNVDIRRSRVKFKRPYNYAASVSNAISIKYKLYSFGIPMDDPEEAAHRYYTEVVFGPKGKKNALIALEHRRWVCEKICNGWVANSDLASAAMGETGNERDKFHVCILKSGTAAPLKNTKVWTHEKWDTAGEDDLGMLDPLDRMSVMLHREYKALADRLRRESTLADPSVMQLERCAQKSKAARIAFSEWYTCLMLLFSGNDEPIREYDKLKASLLDSFSSFGEDDAETARMTVSLVERRLEPIFKSLRYTNYKSYDAALVNFIPFILTHNENMHLVIPFSTGTNTEMFQNVASATVANPSEITYLYYIDRAEECLAFEKALDYVLNYMREKTVSARLRFVILCKNDERGADAVSGIKDMIASAADAKRIKRVTAIRVEDEFGIDEAIFRLFNTGLGFDAIERNETELSSLLVGAGVYEKYPRYQFDINARKFHDTVACEFLKYIKAEQYLTVSDMFATKNSKGYMESPMAFCNDYEKLWKRAYRGQEQIWKKMCGILYTYHENADRVVSFSIDSARDRSQYKKYRFLAPAGAYDGISKIVSFMKEAGIFDSGSEVSYYTADSCEAIILAPSAIEDKLKRLMQDRNVLSRPESIELVKTPYSVSVSFDRLTVTDLDIGEAGKHAERVKALLRMLEQEFSFIGGYTESGINGQLVSFTYATGRIKKLLCVAGNILEIYIYHKCLKSDLFDDVATSYEVAWDGTEVKSEFDIILTRGFAGLLVEAKATSEISQDYYFKLSSLTKQFCTNCKPVLVDDTVESDRADNSNNDMQRLRGSMMDVITVSDPKEIDEIDVTLSRILSGEDEPRVAKKPEKSAITESTASPDGPSRVSDSEAARSAFLGQRISALRIDQSQISLLQNNGVKTVGDFLRQTEESFSMMRTKNGMTFTSQFMMLRDSLIAKLDGMG